MDAVIRYFSITVLILGWISLNEAQCPMNLSTTTLYITDKENCQDYWICSSTIQKKMKCPVNQCFDSSANACTYKKDPDCDENGALSPDCNNCTRYWQCSNGKKSHMICPNYPNLWFNYLTSQCDYIRNYPVLHGCGDIRCTEGPDRKKYVVENDKRKFVWCISGTAFLYSCCEDDEECHFDVDGQLCDFKPMADKNNCIKKDRYLKHLHEVKRNTTICKMAPLLI